VRVLDELYSRNLSLQTLDGVICHNGEFEQQVLNMSDLSSFDEFDRVVEDCWQRGVQAIDRLRPMTLEGCVVRVSDIIAYVGKDRQDAIRVAAVSPESFDDGLGGAYNTWALSAFAADIIEHSFGRDRISMSEEAFKELRRAKRENYQKIYGASEANGDFSDDIKNLFARLYDYELSALASGDESCAIFKHHIEPLQRHLAYYGAVYVWEDDPDRVVVDFISAMTDDYFIATCEALFPEARMLFPKRTYFGNGVHA
jgi:dGTPase